MNADYVRKITLNLNDKLNYYIKEIDNGIKESASMGKRSFEYLYANSEYMKDLSKHYVNKGFSVSRYNDWNHKIVISW